VIFLQVRFRHKIRKLVDGQSLVSARKHTLRLLRTGRFPLNTKRVIETIDLVGFAQIRKRYAVADPGADWPKYLDLDRWIGINIRRIRQIELDLSRPNRILDLGCGAGYFLYIAQLLGHSGVGLDMDRLSMFREVTHLLGVRRVVQRIEAFRTLPDFGQKFDVITAFASTTTRCRTSGRCPNGNSFSMTWQNTSRRAAGSGSNSIRNTTGLSTRLS